MQERGKGMEQFIGTSRSGNIQEAVSGLKNPQFLILCVSNKDVFGQKVQELEQLFPKVPSIGCVGQCYGGTQVLEEGLMVTAFLGDIHAVADVFTEVSTMPVKSIQRFQQNLSKINSGRNNTVLIDFCSGNDECVLATMESAMRQKNIPMTGGTAWEGLVSCNGTVYEDACAYALVKNESGRVKVYKENIYIKKDERRHIVTKSEPRTYTIQEIDGRPAEDVYVNEIGIRPEDMTKQTFVNPLGRVIGDETYIISIKERQANKSFSCYRKVNPKDNICFLQAGDHEAIYQDTIRTIKSDFSCISGVFSINCLFRYLYFQQKGCVKQYFEGMNSLGHHAGLIGLGEHYNGQHTNQTMSAVVFE